MNIAIVDDMDTELKHVSKILNDYAIANQLSLDIHTFQNGEELLSEYRPLQYTVIFLDIFINDENGIEIAKKIRQVDNQTLIVFLTTSQDFMPEAFRVHAYDYIIKCQSPAQKHAMRRSLFKLMDELTKNTTELQKKISFVYDREEHHLVFSDIVCIKSNKHNTEITDSNMTVYCPRMTFASVCNVIQDDNRFLLINRGVMVNMDYITHFDRNICILCDNVRLPINVKNSKNINHIWQNYNFNKIHQEMSAGEEH